MWFITMKPIINATLLTTCVGYPCSEWSNSGSVGALPKPREKPPRAKIQSVRSVKSNSTDSTSASSDSSQRDSFYRRPDLGENVTMKTSIKLLLCLENTQYPSLIGNINELQANVQQQTSWLLSPKRYSSLQ